MKYNVIFREVANDSLHRIGIMANDEIEVVHKFWYAIRHCSPYGFEDVRIVEIEETE